MVFFTCNNCGESVKKPSVAKHLLQCRKPVFVSCMDCLKDFREDYVEHTRCISEAEKYSGKDYVSKESQNKGQKKQDSWLEIVRSILNSTEFDVSPPIRGIFQKLQNFDNVPRKKAKFENFVSNSMRCRKDQAEAVWNVLEQALASFKAARTPAVEEHKKSEENGDATTDERSQENESHEDNSKPKGNIKSTENGIHHNEEETVTSSKKKKKKNVEEENGESILKEEPPKKKKNKKENVDIENGENICKEDSPKKKKNKKKNLDVENSENIVEEEPPKKKKKKKIADESTSITNDELTTLTEEEQVQQSRDEKKSSKKRKLEESNNDNEVPFPEENGSISKIPKANETSDPTTNGKPSKFKVNNHFDWTNVMFKILDKHDNEIKLEKLKSKVLKKYKGRYELDEIPWKVEKTFNKHLRKSGLVVDNDVVKVK